MFATVSSLRKRLTKVERRLATIARREESAKCNCRRCTVAMTFRPEEIEAEMSVPCPVHGLRRLGVIVCLGTRVDEDDDESLKESVRHEDSVLNQLLATYDARLAQQDNQKLEEEDDHAEEL